MIYYQVGADAALVLKYGDTNQAVVKGLNSLTLPGLERSVITVEEFRNDLSRQFAGGGKLGNLGYSGNFVTGDTYGQDQLKAYWIANTKFVDARAYLNLTDFLAPDLAQDSVANGNGWQVTKVDPGQADKNGVFAYSGEIVLNGRPAIFTVHMEDAATPTITFVNGTAAESTIIDSANGFVTAGFKAGMSIIIENGDNDGKVGILKTVAAGTLTLVEIGYLVTDAVGDADTVIHGGLL